MLDHNGSWFLRSGELQLDMAYVCCPEDREHVVRLTTVVVLLKGVSNSAKQFNIFAVLDRLDDVSPLVGNLSWVCNCISERRKQTTRCHRFCDSKFARYWQSVCQVAVCFIHQFQKKSLDVNAVASLSLRWLQSCLISLSKASTRKVFV